MANLQGVSRKCWRAPSASDVVLFNSRYNWEFIPHTHDAATVLLVTEGAVELGVGTKKYITRKGHLAVIGPNQVHSARPAAAGGWSMRSVHIPVALISDATAISIDQCFRMRFADPVHSMPSIGSMFLDLHHCLEAMSSTCGDLQTFVRHLYANIDMFGPIIANDDALDDRLTRARKILTDGAADTIHLSEIAAEVGLSVFSLIRQFQKAFGIAPHGWRIQARANEAARLLRDNHEAAVTAALCGFSDQSHMVRVFKKVFGITPGQYCMLH